MAVVLAIGVEGIKLNLSKRKTVVIAGATGQTGRRVLQLLTQNPTIKAIGGVRNVDKARKDLSESKTVFRGFQIQKLPAVNTHDSHDISLTHLDIVHDSTADMVSTMKDLDALIITTGFVTDPFTLGNPFKMKAASHKVDNVGVCRLIDAAKKGRVKKIILLSSILTNARAWGQTKKPGFFFTNALGNVLDEKLIAETYLRNSGLDYTIIRAAELKDRTPSGYMVVSKEDTLCSGDISRDLVAEFCVQNISDKKYVNKVAEIFEN